MSGRPLGSFWATFEQFLDFAASCQPQTVGGRFVAASREIWTLFGPSWSSGQEEETLVGANGE